MKLDTICHRAISQYGHELQTLVAIEEMGELSHELIKMIRSNKTGVEFHDWDKISNEMADVFICFNTLLLMFNNREQVMDFVDQKSERLSKRIDDWNALHGNKNN